MDTIFSSHYQHHSQFVSHFYLKQPNKFQYIYFIEYYLHLYVDQPITNVFVIVNLNDIQLSIMLNNHHQS
jgi:hypothetical protein